MGGFDVIFYFLEFFFMVGTRAGVEPRVAGIEIQLPTTLPP